MKKFIDEMIDKKLIYNKKTDQGLDSFYQNMEMEDEAPLSTHHTFLSLKIQTVLQKNPYLI